MIDIDLPPFAPVLIESTRAIGYSLEAAISDVIDNSISAGADRIHIRYTPHGEPFIAIFDDGCGMSADKLTESMRYGSGDPSMVRESDDLGRYGLGMKTASLSQCRCLTVVSKVNGEVSGRRWDLDYIKMTGKWSLVALEQEELNTVPLIDELRTLESGTLVIWQKLDKIFSGEINLEDAMTDKMDMVRSHIALVFHRYLPGGDVKKCVQVTVNGDEVKAIDPFFMEKSRIIMDEEKIEIPQYDSVVKVMPYILPHPSKLSVQELAEHGGKDGFRNRQGFYIYRNKRLLIWGTWFRMTKMDEFSKLARVRIDIPNSLDNLWTLDVKKSTATPPEIVKTRLKQIIKNIVNDSKRTYTFRGKRETREEVEHVWNVIDNRGEVRYELNEDHPLYEKLAESVSDDIRPLLQEYIQTIAAKFPINRLHNDIFNEAKFAQESDKEAFLRTKELFESYFNRAEDDEEKRHVLQKLLNVEPFCDHKEKLLELYGVDD